MTWGKAGMQGRIPDAALDAVEQCQVPPSALRRRYAGTHELAARRAAVREGWRDEPSLNHPREMCAAGSSLPVMRETISPSSGRWRWLPEELRPAVLVTAICRRAGLSSASPIR
jgi:hypothetical protein